MLSISPSELHDVSVVCVCGVEELQGKQPLLSRCERKGGNWREQGDTNRLSQTDKLSCVQFESVSWSAVFVSLEVLTPNAVQPQLTSYPTAGPDTILKPQFPHLLALQRNPLCKHYYYIFSPLDVHLALNILAATRLLFQNKLPSQKPQEPLSRLLSCNLPVLVQVGC